MADPKLPGLNYGTPLRLTDLEHLQDVYGDEFTRRTLAMIGSYRSSGADYGIVAETDPTEASAGDPLYVSENENDPMRVDVQAGLGVANNGMVVVLSENVESVAMVNTEVGQKNVVFIEYEVVADEDTTTRTRFNTSEARRLVRAEDTSEDPNDLTTLKVASLQDWNNAVLYPPDRKDGIIPIAYVAIVTSTNSLGKAVSIDLSQTSYPDNRKWFSPVDIAHRSQQGTGSSSVPHSLGLNDLSQGELTLYDQMLSHGMVLGLDADIPGVPGELCLETVTTTRVKIDNDGSKTGTVSQRYVELVRFPTRLLGAYSLGDTTNDILCELLPYSNILVIHHDEEVPDAGFRVQYTCVDAGEPLINSLVNDEVHFRQPVTTRELLVAGGKGHTSISPKFTDSFNNIRARIELGQAPAIPKRYEVLADDDAQLLLTPQFILCATRLDDIGLAEQTFDTTMLGAARLRIGLQNVDLSASTVVRFRLSGTDSVGSTVTEDITFDISTYQTEKVGQCDENPLNWVVTSTVFTGAVSITVLERTADGPNTAVSVLADLDPVQASAIKNACPIAEVMWDGAQVCRIRDIRPLSSSLKNPTRTSPITTAGQSTVSVLAIQGASVMELFSEDMRDPYKMTAAEPLRFDKFADGLRTTILPDQPKEEGTEIGARQDVWVSQAIRAPLDLNRTIAVSALGRDAQSYLMNSQDGLQTLLEYRSSDRATPDVWTAWQTANPLANANGTSFRFTLPDDHFKVQFRARGPLAGLVAYQYSTLATQVFSGIREYASGVPAGDLRVLALPFGQTFPDTDYAIVASVYHTGSVAGTTAPFTVVKIDRYLDHAQIYIAEGSVGGPLSVHWTVTLGPKISTTDEGFGDTVVA